MPILFRSTYQEKYPLEIVGESYNQSNLSEIADLYSEYEEKYFDDTFVAELILENNNPHDPNAVRIDINDKKVGYLSRQNAILYRNGLNSFGKPNEVGLCNAAIYGKKSQEDDQMIFGVWLDLDLNNLVIEKESSQFTISPKIENNQAKSESKNPFNKIRSIFSKK